MKNGDIFLQRETNTLIISGIGHFQDQAPSHPGCRGDRFDEVVDLINNHDGSVRVIDDETYLGVCLYKEMELRRALSGIAQKHTVERLWCGEGEAPLSFEAFRVVKGQRTKLAAEPRPRLASKFLSKKTGPATEREAELSPDF